MYLRSEADLFRGAPVWYGNWSGHLLYLAHLARTLGKAKGKFIGRFRLCAEGFERGTLLAVNTPVHRASASRFDEVGNVEHTMDHARVELAPRVRKCG
jgi:hypothetical protein